MEITEIRIKLMDDPQDRLLAFCSITIDGSFVVRDLKIIRGTKGAFVAMPSRKLMDRCHNCGFKNQLRAGYCNQCGHKLEEQRASRNDTGRAKLYADIAHPIHSECRDQIQSRVIEAYENELVLAKEPGYVCRYDDYSDMDYDLDDWSEGGDSGAARPAATAKLSGPHANFSEQPAEPPRQTSGQRSSSKEGFGEGVF
jgi:stage V sporulation protein G